MNIEDLKKQIPDEMLSISHCLSRWPFLYLLWLFENQEAAQLTYIKTGIGFSCSGEGYPTITNGALQSPVKRRLKLLIGPYIIHLSLFGLTSRLAAAAHLRYIWLFCHMAFDTAMANGRIHGHNHFKRMGIIGSTPIICQVVGLQRITNAMN